MAIIRTVDDKGRVFDRFEVRRDYVHTRKGWVVFGRNPEYGDSLVMVCAWKSERPHSSGYKSAPGRRVGWHTKREAQAIADDMNAGRAA